MKTIELHPNKKWLTNSEAARHSGKSTFTIWNWGRKGMVLIKEDKDRPRGEGKTPRLLYRRYDIEKQMRIVD